MIPSGLRRPGLVLAVCLGCALVAPQAALSISRKQADAVALAALKPGPAAAVFGLPAALPPGSAVSDAGPGAGRRFTVTKHGRGKGETLRVSVARTKLTARGWLFWEDQRAGANFPHPSRLLLVDDRTGRVAWTKSLAWWPLLNDRPAPFFRHSDQAAYRVKAGVRSQARFANDCLLALVDGTDPRPHANFNGDAAAMLGLARSYGMKGEKTTSISGFTSGVRKLVVDEKCKDVVLFIAGHGTPAKGPGATAEPTVILSYHYAPSASGERPP